jgi:hypothetical protein
MRAEIRKLSTSGATVDGQPARMVLDIRVPSGGERALDSLRYYGQQFNVTVKVSSFP